MNFGYAIESLKEGKKIARKGWNGKGMWLSLIFSPTKYHGVNALPWVGLKTADDCFIPWNASQADMLAEDWEIVK